MSTTTPIRLVPRATAVLLAGLALCACGGGEGPSAPARCVILITCDTLRPDHLGLYGYERPTSPHLDEFAREAYVFDSAYSVAPWTRPALSSLMTGRYPHEVGAAPGNLIMMPAEVETLAERVAEHGIATAAIVSNGLIQRRPGGPGDVDLAQGFAYYNDVMTARERNRKMPERRAPETTAAALSWLAGHEASGGGPFFLWVHYQDPHGPYTPPEEYAREFDRPTGGDARRLPLGRTLSGRGQIPLYQALPDERSQARPGQPELRAGVYSDRYDAEIAFFDEHLGRLLARLSQMPWWDEALVVFTADHGEALGEHDDWFCHGESVARELVHVPFLVRYQRGARTPPARRVDGLRRVQRPVSHLDLWPTVLEALELPAGESRGTSLFTHPESDERVLVQSFLAPRPADREWAVTDGRWRLVWGPEGEARLYDLDADPGETRDVAAAHPQIAQGLRLRFETLHARPLGPQVEGQAIDMTPEMEAALRALGYLEAESPTVPPETGDRRDP